MMRWSELLMSGRYLRADGAVGAWDGGAAIDPFASDAEGIDDALHYGRAWHRHRYCYRASRSLRILDAGCGAGKSSTWLAFLNPGSSVLGIDQSATLIEAARSSAKNHAGSGSTLEFLAADLAEPLPEELGTFDFVVCRKVLGEVSDPSRVLQNLAKALKPDGLFYLDLPSKRGRESARSLRRVVEVAAPAGMPLEERASLALKLVQGLRADHPLRVAIHERLGNEPEAVLLDFLVESRDWSFDEAAAMLEASGLRLLHAVNPVGWTIDRVFDEQSLEPGLQNGLRELDPRQVSALVDALDPSSVGQDLQLYACRPEFRPSVPSWPSRHPRSPELFDLLIPHPTGLARPLEQDGRLSSGGRVLYKTVSGAVGELDRLSNLMFLSSDGRSTIGEINFRLAAQTRASDNEEARRLCWMNLADSGLIVLQPAELVS